MKKKLALILSICLLFTLCACGGSDENTQEEEPIVEEETVEIDQPAAEPEETEEESEEYESPSYHYCEGKGGNCGNKVYGSEIMMYCTECDADQDNVEDCYALPEGQYWCMGKNDTCQNKTNDPYDFYCDECDPDGDNIEN